MVPGILEDEKLSADPRLEFESHALRRIRWPGIPVIDGIPGHNVFAGVSIRPQGRAPRASRRYRAGEQYVGAKNGGGAVIRA